MYILGLTEKETQIDNKFYHPFLKFYLAPNKDQTKIEEPIELPIISPNTTTTLTHYINKNSDILKIYSNNDKHRSNLEIALVRFYQQELDSLLLQTYFIGEHTSHSDNGWASRPIIVLEKESSIDLKSTNEKIFQWSENCKDTIHLSKHNI